MALVNSNCEMIKVLNFEEMKNVPLLVYANKQDIAVMDVREVIRSLELVKLIDRDWHCQPSNGLSGQGLMKGLVWLNKKLT